MSTCRMKRYAFVLPRYGKGIAGGAETLAGSLAAQLAARGDAVEILTTCARDNRSWENELPEGQELIDGVLVRRFSVSERDLDSWIPRQIAISEGMNLLLDDQLEWMQHSVNAHELYACLAQEADRFDAILFAPYLFGTTFWGSLVRPDKSVLIPCLHDEHYAYLDVIQSMFRQVRGALFNARAEQELADRLYGALPGGEVGMGFEPWPEEVLADTTPYFKDTFPYVLYIGRKETGKNVQLLIDYFVSAREQGHLAGTKLVIAGGGSFDDLHRPDALLRDDIIDLSHLSERDKRRVIKHATVLCQPSTNESFSIVLMEAWLLGTPVLVHSHCAVTRQHVVDSGGGLYFSNENDFNAVCKRVLDDASLRTAMAEAGRSYVASHYSWKAVLDRFDTVISEVLEEEDVRSSEGR